MLKLAWRNLWRNKRRTLITISSVFFAVFLSILMRGFHVGSWQNLIDNVLHSYTGYVQVHAKGYWENKNFDYSLSANDSVFKKITRIQNVKELIPRLESFSLASAGEKTKGVITVGIDPEKENHFTKLKSRIVSGRYFNKNDTSIILSQRLATFLKLKVNDSLVLLSQGYQGVSATGIFKIAGIVKLPAPEFDNQLVFLPLPVAQEFYSAPNLLSSIVVDVHDPEKIDKTVRHIRKVLGNEHFETMLWTEMLVELYQQYITDEGGALIMLGLLYIIVGFGVFGTVLMMLAERKREMSIMVTLGMQRGRLIQLISVELFIICLLGVICGFVGSIPIITYFHFHPIEMKGEMVKAYEAFGMEPIIPVALQAGYMLQQAFNIFAMIVIVLVYPLYTVYKMNLTKALKR